MPGMQYVVASIGEYCIFFPSSLQRARSSRISWRAQILPITKIVIAGRPPGASEPRALHLGTDKPNSWQLGLDPPLVSVDEYLSPGYHPDREFVDGILVERGVPTIAHSLLQMILIQYFGTASAKRSGSCTLPEARTQIIERGRYRVPDVLLCPLPLPTGKIVTSTPWAVIESPPIG